LHLPQKAASSVARLEICDWDTRHGDSLVVAWSIPCPSSAVDKLTRSGTFGVCTVWARLLRTAQGMDPKRKISGQLQLVQSTCGSCPWRPWSNLVR
jgi:hypothetical protein